MFTVRRSLSALALALAAVATTGAIGTAPAGAATAAAGSITTQAAYEEGTQYCGTGVTPEGCYSLRADYVRHGYKVSGFYWSDWLKQYAFAYWT